MNTTITKIIAGFFFGIFAITASAQSNDVRESFKEVASISMEDIVVPTVVEVQLDTFVERNEFAVYNREGQSYVPYWYNVQYTQVPVVLSVTTNSRDTAKVLLDGVYTTSADFPLPESGQGVAEIALSSKASVTSSELVFSFAQNVARPLSVSLAVVDEYGVIKTVVAQKRMTSNRLLFPETTADTWQIQFTYAQPLRISEVTLVQSGVEKNISRTVRFLAQPDGVYDIFINPDRRVVVPTPEAGDLKNNENVFFVQTPVTGVENILYSKADSDNDGIEDVVDNCVSLANEDQIDKDSNGRGDACDDFDRDGRINSIDNCPNDPNRRQEDEDGDGVGDACDDEESRLTEKYVWIPWVGLGFAASVMVTMFVVLLRRPEEGGEDGSSQGGSIKDERDPVEGQNSVPKEPQSENDLSNN